ncbi:MAG: aconitase family protein, partial [Pseudomonadota bacterium]
MTIEAGARIGLVAPDDTTFAYLKGRPLAPRGALWEAALKYWRSLPSDTGARFAKTIEINVTDLAPQVTWGTTPADCAPITAAVPRPESMANKAQIQHAQKALSYMDLRPGTQLKDVKIDKVFVGSCTNSRLEDLRRGAEVARGRKIAGGVTGIIVPGSAQVQAAAQAEGLDRIYKDAGFEWRNAGCSMCVAMNEDRLEPGERCASTSNRNFEGRQGSGGRTHLMSPEMAVAAGLTGRLTDVRDLLGSVSG